MATLSGALKVVLIVFAAAVLLVAGTCGLLILGASSPQSLRWIAIALGVALVVGFLYFLSRGGRT